MLPGSCLRFSRARGPAIPPRSSAVGLRPHRIPAPKADARMFLPAHSRHTLEQALHLIHLRFRRRHRLPPRDSPTTHDTSSASLLRDGIPDVDTAPHAPAPHVLLPQILTVRLLDAALLTPSSPLLSCLGPDGELLRQDRSSFQCGLGPRVPALTDWRFEDGSRRTITRVGLLKAPVSRDRLSLRHPRCLGLFRGLLLVTSIAHRFLLLTPLTHDRFRPALLLPSCTNGPRCWRPLSSRAWRQSGSKVPYIV